MFRVLLYSAHIEQIITARGEAFVDATKAMREANQRGWCVLGVAGRPKRAPRHRRANNFTSARRKDSYIYTP